jgi:F-type H+-transporting ATPase subunit a
MHNPLDQFKIQQIIPMELFGYDISFTNSSLFMVFALFTIFGILTASVIKLSPIPSKIQALGEILYNLITDMLNETAGDEGKKFAPFIFTLFMFILTCNLLGMLPFSFTVTSHIIVTFAMGLFVFTIVTLVGFIRHGLHFFSLFVPKGIPLLMAPLMIPIELFSYMVRPVSLSIRLAANMSAGHMILKVFASFSILGGLALGILPFTLLTILTGFEIFVAILQAYIFTILTCVYLTDAIKLH